jgi:Ran GTPase-activating protein (RanGAP) involved in mRNA processing and transport
VLRVLGKLLTGVKLGFKLNKNQVEDGWWKKSYSAALGGVKKNYVASDNDDSSSDETESEYDSSSDEESEAQEKTSESESESESEYDDDDELAFQNIAKKYLKTK